MLKKKEFVRSQMMEKSETQVKNKSIKYQDSEEQAEDQMSTSESRQEGKISTCQLQQVDKISVDLMVSKRSSKTDQTDKVMSQKESSSSSTPASPISGDSMSPPPLERSQSLTPERLMEGTHKRRTLDHESSSSVSDLVSKRRRLLLQGISASLFPCDWCFQVSQPQFSIRSEDSENIKGVKLFCSEQCFSHYRRAIFKHTRVCNTCHKTNLANNTLEIQLGEGSLHFCDTSCRGLYEGSLLVQSLHKSEGNQNGTATTSENTQTSRGQKEDILQFSPSQLRLAQAFLHAANLAAKPSTVDESLISPSLENTKVTPGVKLKPEHLLKEIPSTNSTVTRANIARRMAIRDQPSRVPFSQEMKVSVPQVRTSCRRQQEVKCSSIRKNGNIGNKIEHQQHMTRKQTGKITDHTKMYVGSLPPQHPDHHTAPLLPPSIARQLHLHIPPGGPVGGPLLPPPPLLPSILPPPTLLLPFPIIIPIPIPIPFPIPMYNINLNKDSNNTQKVSTESSSLREYEDLDLCDTNLVIDIKKEKEDIPNIDFPSEKKTYDDSVNNTDSIVKILSVQCKKEIDNDSQPVLCEDNTIPVKSSVQKASPMKSPNSEDENRKKRRALIMDR